MKWRKISEADVMMTLENPERTEDTIKGRKNAYRLYRGKRGDSSRFSTWKIGSCPPFPPAFPSTGWELIIGSCPPFFLKR
jgi:hypothetical protein